MNEKIYYVGFFADKKTVIIQLRQNIDCLNCEIFSYYGQRITTKEKIKQHKKELLKEINKEYNKNFKYIKID